MSCIDPLEASELLSLHHRFVAGDPKANIELAERLFPALCQAVQAYAFPGDPHLCIEAAGTAMMEYLKDPARYDPSRSGLWTFLLNAAQRDYLNLTAKEKRFRNRHHDHFPVETLPADGKSEAEEFFADPPPWWLEIIADFSAAEARCWRFMRESPGYDSMALADAVGIDPDLPDIERRRAAQRMRERIIKRMQRAREAHE